MNQPDMSGQQPDASNHSLTVEEASGRFFEAGVPRSPRTVIRYCSRGYLDCTKVDTERNEKYLIASHSVEARIMELKQALETRHVESRLDKSGHVELSLDSVQMQELRTENETLEKKVSELAAENMDLKIATRAKDQYLERLHEDRVLLMDQMRTQSHHIGELETRLQLGAPVSPPETEAPDDNPQEHSQEVLGI